MVTDDESATGDHADEAANMARRLADDLAGWNPEKRPIHCSNCLFAVVEQAPDQYGVPQVVCAKGHGGGKTVSLIRLIRERLPMGFAAAAKCSDFTSMSDPK